MHLRLFPFDEQTCHLYVASCKISFFMLCHSETLCICLANWLHCSQQQSLAGCDDVILRWMDQDWCDLCLGWRLSITICLQPESAGGVQAGHVWSWLLRCQDQHWRIQLSPGTEYLPCALQANVNHLQVDLVFARELSYFMVTMYVPCTMIVVVSWFAFWIDHKSVSFVSNLFFFKHYLKEQIFAIQ